MAEQSQMSEGREVWRECMRWMTDAGLIDPAAQDSVTMDSFAACMRDGVVLCHLADVICPGAIPRRDIVAKPASQFHASRNIALFLNFCRDVIHMRPEDLFQASDLYNMQNLLKVLNTLSILSYSEQSQMRDLQPFPPRLSTEIHTPTRSSSCFPDASSSSHRRVLSPSHGEEEIYQQLPDRVDEIEVNQDIYVPIHYQNMGQQESEEKVYDVLVKQPYAEGLREPTTDRVQQSLAAFMPKSRREHVIKELLETEQNYVENGLNMLHRKFDCPLENVLKADDHRTIFMNIRDLWCFHTNFQMQLTAAAQHDLGIEKSNGEGISRTPNSIADVFKRNKRDFTLYGVYCTGLDEARACIEKVEKDTTLKKRIAEIYGTLQSQQFKLQDLLCLPMQRILKYHLLLRELVKETDLSSADRIPLEEAKEAMEDVNEYVNELKRDMEKKTQISLIQASITDLQMPENMTLIDYGRDAKDEEFKISEVTSSSSVGKWKTRHIFLFDKVLFICKAARNNAYTYKGAYIVSELKAERGDGSASTSNGIGGTIRKLGGGQHVLTLHRTPHTHSTAAASQAVGESADPVRAINLAFKTEGQRKAWLEAFERVRRNVCPDTGSSGHIVHYTSFSATQAAEKGDQWPPVCAVCSRFLKGLFYQGYRCDRCNQSLHRECLGMSVCVGKRRHSSAHITGSSSFSGTSSNGAVPRTRRTNSAAGSYICGDRIVATRRQSGDDGSHLSCEQNDILEVLHANGANTLMACHVSNRAKKGLVSVDGVRRLRTPSAISSATSPALSLLDSPISRPGSTISAAGVIQRKESTILPRQPPMSIVSPTMEYVNTEVTAQSWFFGELTREESEARLTGTPNGTFLVRFSPKKRQCAISISYNGEVKHTVVEEPGDGHYYLDEGYKFRSIVELVNYYRENNLKESFQMLDTRLTKPFTECKLFRVIHPYCARDSLDPPEAADDLGQRVRPRINESKFLELKVDEIVTLIDTVGEERGWWKGKIGDRVGFFPLNYVEKWMDNGGERIS